MTRAKRPKTKKEKEVETVEQTQYDVKVNPITQCQKELIYQIMKNDIILVTGPAGGGKTSLSIGMALQALFRREISKIIITRPAVYEGKGLGYLPGDISDKMAPFLIPIYDELKRYVPVDRLANMVGMSNYNEDPEIEIVPLEYMRGRTFRSSYILVDESQNCTIAQLKTILTRIGQGSKIIINGDLNQSDLPIEKQGGLKTIISKLSNLNRISHVDMKTVVRHDIIEKILKALDNI
jgi:phosphate starvation-inducible PhoH-like protein